MASTRNKNTNTNYCIQQRQFQDNMLYNTYTHSQWGESYTTHLPTYGLNTPNLPRDKLSSNPIETESYLFGINSTNLVKPAKPVVPEVKKLDNLTFFDKLPLQIPEPLVIKNNQRPNW
jgi:hypothetical protein